jgi:hypothetical protein
MKIQLKRSNVLAGGKAKEPTAAQTEYGELCVNYNAADPVIFIKDSNNQIIRLTNINQIIEWDDIIGKPTPPVIPDVYDGGIAVEAGDGLMATGDNATANQAIDTVRTLAAVADPGYAIDVTPTGIRFGDSWVNIPNLP